MIKVEHVNAGWIQVPGGPRACCHCLVLRDIGGVALVDTGIGMADVLDPEGRIGRRLIDLAGFQFNADDTMLSQLRQLGIAREDVVDILVTHLDPDHAGGLADFPTARIHLSGEELRALSGGDERYLRPQFAHNPRWMPHEAGRPIDWFGFDAREVPLDFTSQVLLVPLPGHTAGHCGVAIEQGGKWLLHTGDAYYLRAELANPQHPVGRLAAARAVDDQARLQSLERLRRLLSDHGDGVTTVGTHDTSELQRVTEATP